MWRMSMENRISKDDYYLDIALTVSKGYNEFEVGIDSITYTSSTEIRYIKKYE